MYVHFPKNKIQYDTMWKRTELPCAKQISGYVSDLYNHANAEIECFAVAEVKHVFEHVQVH